MTQSRRKIATLHGQARRIAAILLQEVRKTVIVGAARPGTAHLDHKADWEMPCLQHLRCRCWHPTLIAHSGFPDCAASVQLLVGSQAGGASPVWRLHA